MQFGLSEEQVLLQDTVNRFLDDNAPLERVRAFAAGDDDMATVWQGLAELGVPGLIVPERLGGVGLGQLDAMVIAEAIGAHATPTPLLSAIMAPTALLAAGGQDDLVTTIAAGEVTVALALSETVGARLDGGVTASNGTLSGTAYWVVDAPADFYLIAEKTGGLHLVAGDAAGLTTKPLRTVDLTRTMSALALDAVQATPISDDPEVLARTLDVGRVMLAADTLGAAQHMLTEAVEYAKQREQFNRPIGSFQAVKHMCAEMAANLEPCRAMAWFAAHALDEVPEEARLTACHTKAHLSEVGKFVAKTATEVHGGMGFTDLLGLHYWFKRIGANRQLLGTPERLREEAAQLQGLAA